MKRKGDLTKNEILALTPGEIRVLSDSQLRRYTQILADAANKAIRRMAADPATSGNYRVEQYKELQKLTGSRPVFFSTKGKTRRSEIKSVFDAVRDFHKAKTNTVSGFKKRQKAIEKRHGFAPTPDMWKAIRQLMAEFGGTVSGFGSEEAIQMVIAIDKNGTMPFEDIVAEAEKILSKAYEDQYDDEGEEDDEDDFDWSDYL